MHRLRSKSAVFRFRLAALLLCSKCILVPVAAGGIAYSIIIADQKFTLISVGAATLAGVVGILQWLFAERTNCPLCITPVLASRECTKNRHARKLIGSHRLHTALSILLRKSFRCPYCNEPTAVEVRQRHRHPSDSRG